MRPSLAFAALAMLAACTSVREAPPSPSPDNARLAELFTQDQDDRLAEGLDWTTVERHDAEHRREVLAMLEAGAVRTGADHYHAAMIFQHGPDSTSHKRAWDLAATAERMGDERARWLAAAAHDRYLITIGQPQIYGTQFAVRDDVWYLDSIDTLAVTDAERQRVGARTLDEIRTYLAEQNGTPTGSLAPPPEPAEVEDTVELVGGIEGLTAQLQYPEEARTAGVDGAVRVQLTIAADGTVEDAFVVEGPGHGLDEEALRVVRAATFVNHMGEPWEIRLVIPFTL